MRPKHPEVPVSMSFIHVCSFSRVPPETIWRTMGEKKSLKEKNNKSFSNHPHPICSWNICFIINSAVVTVMVLSFACCRGGCCHYCCCCFFFGFVFFSLFESNCHMKQCSVGKKIPPLCASNRPFTTLLMTCQFPCSSIFCPINSFLTLRIKADNGAPPPHNKSLKFSGSPLWHLAFSLRQLGKAAWHACQCPVWNSTQQKGVLDNSLISSTLAACEL